MQSDLRPHGWSVASRSRRRYSPLTKLPSTRLRPIRSIVIPSISRPDIRLGPRLGRLLPAGSRPYILLARLDRPIGTWLLLFPGWWAIALAAGAWPDLHLIALFGVGAVVMRGAGCTLNDIVDRKFDAQVARTRTRPIPSGAISVRAAAAFLLLQLAAGAAILLALTPLARALGVGVLVLVATYPFMKRITWWPQLFLGLNFNWGALMGWAAVTDSLALPALLLYFGGILWTLGYDTIYAHQDKEDDVRIGVKSSALRLGSATRPWLFGFYGGAAILFGAAGVAAGLGGLFWLGWAAAFAHLLWQAARVDIDDPENCLYLFRANRFVGWLLLAGIVAARVTSA